MAVYFISGSDTGCGKTFVTGMLARRALEAGRSVTTQKFIQTGCQGISEDIVEHRRLMGRPLDALDEDRTTCPYVLEFPASPHLAAQMEGAVIDCERIKQCTKILQSQFDTVFIEGAGGLMVPVTRDYLTIDYIADNQLPLIFVANAKLGSINHTLLSLEVCRARGIQLAQFIFNRHPFDTPREIAEESERFLENFVRKHFPQVECRVL